MTTAIIFPGQGAQTSGMCNELYHNYLYIRNLWGRFDEVTETSFSEKLLACDDEMLKRTSLTQMALFLSEVSVWTVLQEELGLSVSNMIFSGHSVGEYAALVASGSIDFALASELIVIRGQCMESCQEEGGLVALLGGSEQDVEALLAKVNASVQKPCMISGYNGAGQSVVGGPLETLQLLKESVQEFNIKRAVSLAVSGPFHTPYMAQAQTKLQKKIATAIINDPQGKVVSSVTGSVLRDADAVRSALMEQVVSPVRWLQSMKTLYDLGAREYYESGPGSTLTNLLKREYSDVAALPYAKVLMNKGRDK